MSEKDIVRRMFAGRDAWLLLGSRSSVQAKPDERSWQATAS
jgi:hypothetical protein